MPISVSIPSKTEPGVTYPAWVWGPRLRLDAAAQVIAVEYDAYASAEAAYGGGVPIGPPYTLVLAGKDFRNFVRANPSLYTSLTEAVDAVASKVAAIAGGTVVPGTLPAWASEPIEE